MHDTHGPLAPRRDWFFDAYDLEDAPAPWVAPPPVAEPGPVKAEAVIRLLDEQMTRAAVERTPYELSIGADGAKAKGPDPWTVFWLAVGGLAAGATIVVTARHVDRMLAASVRGG